MRPSQSGPTLRTLASLVMAVTILCGYTLASDGDEIPAAAFRDLETAIACRHPVKPDSLLRTLQRAGIIGAKPHNVIDGIPVFEFVRPMRLNGMTAKFISGWDYESDLFIRAPGTAPGVHIEVTLEGSETAAERRFSASPHTADQFYASDLIPAFNFERRDGLVSVVCQFSD